MREAGPGRGTRGRGAREASSGFSILKAGDAAELGEDVRVVGLEPVAKAPAHELRGRRPRSALEHEVLAVEEVGRIPLVAGNPRLESWMEHERRLRPFPSIA